MEKRMKMPAKLIRKTFHETRLFLLIDASDIVLLSAEAVPKAALLGDMIFPENLPSSSA